MSLPQHYFPQAAIGGDLKTAEPYFSNPDYVAQEKLDGARYILHKDMQGRVRIYSRQISRVTGAPVDKTLQLSHLAKSAAELPNGTVLDGEVVAPVTNSSSNLVTRVTGSKPERALEVQQESGFLQYKVFDCLAYRGKDVTDEPYSLRDSFLLDLLVDRPYISRLPNSHGEEHMRALYDAVVKRGGEGIILKDLAAPYYQGDRHKSWVKVKACRTFDVVFMGIELAEAETIKKGSSKATASRIAGKAGAIIFGQYVPKLQNGIFIDFDAPLLATGCDGPIMTAELVKLGTTSGFDDAVRDDITQNAQVYTQQKRVFEVEANEQFSSGALRHPRFKQWRDDKRAIDCIFRKDEG